MDDAKHDDGCRCMACCSAKFKTIAPARFGGTPTQGDNPFLTAAASNPLPHGDPCPKCTAASADADERNRVCHCQKCPHCDALCGNSCAYCGASLGCGRHEVRIDDHVASDCTASAAIRAEVDAAVQAGRPMRLCSQTLNGARCEVLRPADEA